MTSKLGGDDFDIIMVGYQNGSLIAYFVLVTHGQQFIEARNLTIELTEVVQTMLDNQTEVTVQGECFFITRNNKKVFLVDPLRSC